MCNRGFPTRALLVLACTAAFAVACDDDATGPGTDDDFESSPLFGVTVMQIDRFGLPAINTAFVAEAADRDAFNQSSPVNDGEFLPVASGVIQARYGLDATQAAALADFVLPDIQPLGDLDGFPNGRRLEDDVIDVELNLIFGVFGPAVPPLQSDGVDANDVPLRGPVPVSRRAAHTLSKRPARDRGSGEHRIPPLRVETCCPIV